MSATTPDLDFAEVRAWAVWLRVFTAQDLANAMAVDVAVAQRGIRALEFNGIVADTGDRIWDSAAGEERIFGYVPLPPGPKQHETPWTPPPWLLPPELAGFREVLAPRGEPVRIRTERYLRSVSSTPGQRKRVADSQRAWERLQEARQRRAA